MTKVDNNQSSDVNFNDDEKDFDDVVYEALRDAKKKFQEVLESHNYDPAYCDIKFVAWVVDTSFTARLRKIEIEDEVKNE